MHHRAGRAILLRGTVVEPDALLTLGAAPLLAGGQAHGGVFRTEEALRAALGRIHEAGAPDTNLQALQPWLARLRPVVGEAPASLPFPTHALGDARTDAGPLALGLRTPGRFRPSLHSTSVMHSLVHTEGDVPALQTSQGRVAIRALLTGAEVRLSLASLLMGEHRDDLPRHPHRGCLVLRRPAAPAPAAVAAALPAELRAPRARSWLQALPRTQLSSVGSSQRAAPAHRPMGTRALAAARELSWSACWSFLMARRMEPPGPKVRMHPTSATRHSAHTQVFRQRIAPPSAMATGESSRPRGPTASAGAAAARCRSPTPTRGSSPRWRSSG